MCGLLINTVFVNLHWIIDVLKGLIRHDRDLLLQYGETHRDPEFVRRTRRLIVHGILHPDLLIFLWPGDDAAAVYWDIVARSAEAESWTKNPKLISGDHCLDRILALLKVADLTILDVSLRKFGSVSQM